ESEEYELTSSHNKPKEYRQTLSCYESKELELSSFTLNESKA
ncbi:3022_t:CDS:1, partial [Racocetra fulgida]